LALGVRSVALGAGSSATHADSAAIGAGATTTASNQVALGGAGSSVKVGDIDASTSSQSGAVGVATVDADGTLGRDTTILPAIQALQAAIGTSPAELAAARAENETQSAQIDTLFDLSDANRRDIREANEGVAMALAMDSPGMSEGSSFALSYGVGYYNNRTAATAAFSARLSSRSYVSGGIGIGMNSGDVGARAGMRHEW
jgi:hypothetical protein